MMVTSLEWSEYVGRVAIGRIQSGTVRKNQKVVLIREDGRHEPGEIASVELFDKLGRNEVSSADAGDIVALVGLPGPGNRRHDRLPRSTGGPQADQRRRADALDGLHDQQFTAGRPGREISSPAGTCEHACFASSSPTSPCASMRRGQGFVHRFGSRHSASVDPDRDHATRRLRAVASASRRSSARKIDGEWHEPFEILVIDVPAADVGR